MLSNRSTSILNVSNFLICLSFLLSCTTPARKKSVIQQPKPTTTRTSECTNEYADSDMRFLTKSAMYRSQALQSCFKNYLQFEENKKQTIYTCNVLTVNRQGKVSYVYSRGYKGSIIPKDLKMCLEQGFWKMQFKGLQLSRGYTIKFPLSFQSI